MSKYTRKLKEIVPKDADVFELTKEKSHDLKGETADLVSGGIFRLFHAFKSLGSMKEANFLMTSEDVGELITIDKYNNIERTDVTTALQQTKNRKQFVWKESKYTILRRLQ